jgi:hypothetical protein
VPAVYPIVWVPPAVTGYYRNLQRRDLAVWERFLLKHGTEYEAVAYDVAVGGVEPIGEELTEQEIRGWRYTTALKIDALLRSGGVVTAVEVKPAASVSALGAALTYELALARDEPGLAIGRPGIVCEHLPPDIAWAAEKLGVLTWVV